MAHALRVQGVRRQATWASRVLSFAAGALLLVLTFLTALAVPHAVGIWRYPQTAQVVCDADALLVMGAAQYSGVPSPAFARRLEGALNLFEQHCAARILVTGGRGEGDALSEGEAGVRYLAERGVPEAALLAETESRSSVQNLTLSRPLIQGERLLIVTDDMHAYRTQWLAHHFSLDAQVAPVETGPFRLGYGLRELAALLAYQLGVFR